MPPIDSQRIQEMTKLLNDDEAWAFVTLSHDTTIELQKLDARQWLRLVTYRRMCRAGWFNEGLAS